TARCGGGVGAERIDTGVAEKAKRQRDRLVVAGVHGMRTRNCQLPGVGRRRDSHRDCVARHRGAIDRGGERAPAAAPSTAPTTATARTGTIRAAARAKYNHCCYSGGKRRLRRRSHHGTPTSKTPLVTSRGDVAGLPPCGCNLPPKVPLTRC